MTESQGESQGAERPAAPPEKPEQPGQPQQPANPEKQRPEGAAAPGAEVAERAADAPDVRASDADRDRVADILREALAEGRLDAEEHSDRLDAVYAAKTVGELRPLVRDLPAQPGHEATVRPAPQAAPPSGAGASHQDNLIGIFAGSVRKGRYRVPPRINAVAVFGGVEIDLTEAVFEHQQVVITAVAVFGGVEIKVPENVTLQHKGAGVFGGFDVRVQEADEPGAPVVLVQGAAVFGGVEAKPKRGRRLRDLHRPLHRRDRKEL